MSHSYTWLRCWSYGGAISLWMGCAAVQPTVNTSATPPKATPTTPASSTPDSSAAGTRALSADAGAPPLVACVSSDITESRLTAAAPLRALDDWPIDGSDPVPGSDKSVPILRCGAMDSYSFVASIYRCADGSNPLRGNTRAGAGARRGNVGPNQRGHIIDLYEVPCPGGAERVFVDMYECPRDPQGVPSAKAMRVREPLPKESQDLLEAGLKLLDDEKYREAIVNAPNIQLYTFANLTNLTTNAEGNLVTEAEVKNLEGKSYTVKAKQFILAAGAIQNARMLLAALARVFAELKENASVMRDSSAAGMTGLSRRR